MEAGVNLGVTFPGLSVGSSPGQGTAQESWRSGGMGLGRGAVLKGLSLPACKICKWGQCTDTQEALGVGKG